jgi:hypothetical protein
VPPLTRSLAHSLLLLLLPLLLLLLLLLHLPSLFERLTWQRLAHCHTPAEYKLIYAKMCVSFSEKKNLGVKAHTLSQLWLRGHDHPTSLGVILVLQLRPQGVLRVNALLAGGQQRQCALLQRVCLLSQESKIGEAVPNLV